MWTRSVVHHLAESIFSLLQCFNKLMVYVRPCLHTQIGRVESSHLLSGYSKKEKCWSAASLLICFPKVTYYQIANSVFSCLIYIRESTFNIFTTQQLTLEEKKLHIIMTVLKQKTETHMLVLQNMQRNVTISFSFAIEGQQMSLSELLSAHLFQKMK